MGTTSVPDPLSWDFRAGLPLPRVGEEGSEHPHPLDGYLWAKTKSVGWDLDLETGDPPERARPSQLGAESGQKATCSQMPAPSQTYLQAGALWGQLHPQRHTKPGMEGGVQQLPQRSTTGTALS